MNKGIAGAALLGTLIFSMQSGAQVYQCKDDKGRASFSDKPCTGSLQSADAASQDTGGPITSADVFMIEERYKAQVARMLNRLASEHGHCKQRIDPATAGASHEYSVPGNPSFFVQCGDRTVPTVVRFTLKDMEGRGAITAPAQVKRSDAISMCRNAAREKAYRPSSVDFSVIMDLVVTERANGETTVSSTFTAENAYGAENKFDIRCHFSGETLSEVNISRTN